MKHLKSTETALRYADQISDNAWSSFLRFTILHDAGRDDEALAIVAQTSLESFPKSVQTEAFQRLGRLYQKRGDIDQALAAYHRATEIPGGKIAYWFGACKSAAGIHRDRGETDKEIELYRLCLTKPVFLAARNDCLFAYAAHLARAGNFTEAFAVLDAEKAVFDSRKPDYWSARFLIEYAQILDLSGDRVKAIDVYDRAERRGATASQIIQIEKARQELVDRLFLDL